MELDKTVTAANMISVTCTNTGGYYVTGASCDVSNDSVGQFVEYSCT